MDKISQEVGLIVLVSLFFLLVAIGIVVLVLIYRRKQAEYIHEQTRMKAAFEKELLQSQLQMQEQTMKHISQEIHDNIGATLSFVKLNLNTISREPNDPSLPKLNDATDLLTKAINDVRTISKTLNADAVLSMGFLKAIETEVKHLRKTNTFAITVSVSGTPLEIDRHKELILFRIVQEALNNAVKHSDAASIEITLTYSDTNLQLTIYDNGKGFDQLAIENNPEKGSGLHNMQTRAKMIGAEFLINGSPGTRIQITLPNIAS